MIEYIHQLPDWPNFRWDKESLSSLAADVRFRQGRLIGRMESLGFSQRNETILKALTDNVVKSSEIEGDILNSDQVRSSIARKLGLDIAGLLPSDRLVDGVVQMVLEATQNYSQPLSKERLFGWHRALFPEPSKTIQVGLWRDDAKGPMQVVSGAIGRERVHYEAPAANRLEAEMEAFLNWVNQPNDSDPLFRAAKAHLWFVTLHPFDDGNGRMARAITDWALALSENSAQRYYSMSAQICRERKEYYGVLERTQKGTLDITEWMKWFLECLDRAMAGVEDSLATVYRKDQFWKAHNHLIMNERQKLILNKLLDQSFEGKLTSSKWAKITKCSQDTAQRDITRLMIHGILEKESAGGRTTSYSLKGTPPQKSK